MSDTKYYREDLHGNEGLIWRVDASSVYKKASDCSDWVISNLWGSDPVGFVYAPLGKLVEVDEYGDKL